MSPFYIIIVSQPEPVITYPANATSVTVEWTASPIFTQLKLISYFTATGDVINEYETVLSPGVASSDIVLENGLTLDDSKEEIEHNFTLCYTLHGDACDGPVTTVTFTFGKSKSQITCKTIKSCLFYR